MAKYSKGAQKSVESAMHRMKKGKLESGNSEKKVKNPKQAIAIGLSEARKKGAKVPPKRGGAAPKKPAPKKRSGAKPGPKPAASKAAKKAAPKKSAGRKRATKKAAPKKK